MAATPQPTPAATPQPTATVTPQPTVAATPLATSGLVATSPAPSTSVTLVVGQPAPGPVGLVRSDGSPFRLADEAGHPAILFFGYTHCPDVCPETIATLLEVQRARPDVRIVFVTVDPERDTPEFLAEWTAYMSDGIVGVTGSPAAIRQAADLYGVQYARVDTGSVGGYSMAHTAFQYLVDEDGSLVRIYPFATPPETIIGDLDALQ
ncbi:MAG: SCO family protein [Chloroflexota bacterium]